MGSSLTTKRKLGIGQVGAISACCVDGALDDVLLDAEEDLYADLYRELEVCKVIG